MSISTVKNNLAESILSMKQDWDGDIVELDCDWKDHFCYIFLDVMESWWDDILPCPVIDRRGFLELLYNGSNDESLSGVLRDDIYLAVEPTLRDIVQEVYDECYSAFVEPFPGYERGQ